MVSELVSHQVFGSLPPAMATFLRYPLALIEPISVRQFKYSLGVVKTRNVYAMAVGYLIEHAAKAIVMNGTGSELVYALKRYLTKSTPS